VNQRFSIGALIGRNATEVTKSCVIAGLVIAVFVLAGQARRGSRSPKPREWNVYSQEANDALYAARAEIVPKPHPLVAHAAGKLADVPCSNSIEALGTNYALGFRLFEMDFNWTSDGEVVAVHDWNALSGVQKYRGPSLQEFVSAGGGKFSPTTLQMVYAWLQSHPDAFIVTDTKTRGMEVLARVRMARPNLVPQFIPQIYLMEDYELVRSQGFRHIILTLYRGLEDTPDETLLAFSRTHPLFALTMPVAKCQRSDLAVKLRAQGVTTYAHTVNDLKLLRELGKRGIIGVYTDSLTPGMLGAAITP
jgi:glycerophosphoryl diester phosphodiesterase